MSKAEDYITQNTKTLEEYGKEYFKWLTPDQALRAVEIAREEMIEKAQDWIADTFKYDGSEDFNGGDNDVMSMLLDDFTEYIKKAMKDE